MRTEAGAKAHGSKYTAVVYFHGMGSQRRLEEVSRLVDALDRYGHSRRDVIGDLARIKLRVEPRRPDNSAEVAYIRLDKRPCGGSDHPARHVFRFYEAYWANVTAGGVSSKEVLSWLLGRLPTPIRALRAPWRSRGRLRRSALHAHWPWIAKPVAGVAKGDLKGLLEDYDLFEGWDARRDWPKGSFSDFAKFIASRHKDAGERRTRLVALARRWHRSYVTSELRNLFLLLTFALAAGLTLIGSASLLLMILQYVMPSLSNAPFAAWLPKVDLKTCLPIAVSVMAGLGGRRFLSEFLGDVQFWTTYEETSSKNAKRREILDSCSATLRHVLADDQCERVVVVAHSLGTTVAVDTILALARTNRATSPIDETKGAIRLDKIQHLVTMGSPVDKVHYFFESNGARGHRYSRAVEELRGDIGSYPFAFGGRPLIHWINFWDRADIISGALHSPTNRDLPSLSVDNFETRNLKWPDLLSAHTEYTENAEVVGTIFDVVFENAHNYALAPLHTPPGKHKESPDYAAQRLGPGSAGKASTYLLRGLIAVPWLAIGAIAAVWLNVGWLAAGLALLGLVPVLCVAGLKLATMIGLGTHLDVDGDFIPRKLSPTDPAPGGT